MKTVLLFLLLVSVAHATTYNVYTLDSDESRHVVGFDAQGDVVLMTDIFEGDCAPYNPVCYRTYSNGMLTATSSIKPGLINDEGVSCGPGCVENNGKTVYFSNDNLYTPLGEVFVGQGTGAFLYLNSTGTILWNDPRAEFWLEAFEPVPEPASILLVLLGLSIFRTTARRSTQS